MANILTSQEQRRYREDGIVFPISVLSAAEADRFRSACDDLEVQLGGKPRTIEVRQMHLHFPWAYELATHPRVLDAVEDVLGPDLLVFATELFAKHPHDPVVSIGWHRDRTYMEFTSELTVTAWMALTSSTAENGCMCAVREPQRPGTRQHTHMPAAGSAADWQMRTRASSAGENRIPDVPDEAITKVVLDAGQMSLHDVHILHGSGPNLSDQKRVGFAVRFVAPAARPRGNGSPAILARGRDRYNHFQLVDPPVEVPSEQALSDMRQSALRHLEATLANVKQAARK